MFCFPCKGQVGDADDTWSETSDMPGLYLDTATQVWHGTVIFTGCTGAKILLWPWTTLCQLFLKNLKVQQQTYTLCLICKDSITKRTSLHCVNHPSLMFWFCSLGFLPPCWSVQDWSVNCHFSAKIIIIPVKQWFTQKSPTPNRNAKLLPWQDL